MNNHYDFRVSDAASWPFKLFFLPFIYLTSLISLLFIVMVCLGVKLNFWTLFGGVSVGGRIQNEPPNHPTVIDEISLRRTIEYDNESHYIITQVGTIRRCITAVKSEVSMEPIQNKNPSMSTVKLRFPISSVLENLRNRGDKQISFHDDTSGHSSSNQWNFRNQNSAKNESTVAHHQDQNFSISSTRELESKLGSGDNLSRNLSHIDPSIQDHWNNILQQLNCNITPRKSTPRIMSSRSIIHRKKYK